MAVDAGAQVVTRASDLLLRVNQGDMLTVTEQSGHVVRGRLVRVSGDDLILATDGRRQRALPLQTIREVWRRAGDPVSDGALKGLGTGAALGAIAGGASARSGGGALGGAILAGATFAGIGVLVDAAVRRRELVYRAGVAGDIPAGPALPTPAGSAPSPTARRSIASFAEVSLRLNVGDDVTLTEVDGTTHRGRVTAMTPAALELLGRPTIPAERVQRISRCCDSIRNGILIGAVTMGALGFLGGYGSADRAPGEAGLSLAVIFGGLGAGLGAGIDAAIRGQTTVWERTSP